MTEFKSDEFCTYEGYAVQFFLFSAILWTSCMSLQCLIAIARKSSLESLAHMEKWYHLISWGIPAIMALAIGLYSQFVVKENVMGDALLLCWMNKKYAS